MTPLPTWSFWLPLAAVALHVCEEFVWPGGFLEWYEVYRPGVRAGLSTGFLVAVNALLLGLAAVPAALGPTSSGVGYGLVALSIMAANAVFHVRGALATRRYSPGLATAVALYLPLAALGFAWACRTRAAAPATLLQAALAGPLYNAYSAWRYRRRAGAARSRSSGA